MRKTYPQKIWLSGAIAVFLLCPLTLIQLDSISFYHEIKRQAYEQFLNEHPFNTSKKLTVEEIKGLEKADRPDLAYQQNYLATIDPATGTVPSERLMSAYYYAEHKRNQNTTGNQNGAYGPITSPTAISWEERGPSNIGGRTRAVMFDPNDGTNKKVFAGGVGGGLWYTTDITNSGASWTKVNDLMDNLAITTLAYDPTGTDTLFAGTGEGYYNLDAIRGAGIFKSTDAGATWTQLAATNNSNFYYVQKVIVHPTTGDIYAATRNNGIMRSQNGGTSWSKVLGSGTGASTNRGSRPGIRC